MISASVGARDSCSSFDVKVVVWHEACLPPFSNRGGDCTATWKRARFPGVAFCQWLPKDDNTIEWTWSGIGSPQNPIDIDVFYVTQQGGHHMPDLPAAMAHAGVADGEIGSFEYQFDINNPNDAAFFASPVVDASIWTGEYDISCWPVLD